MIFAAVLFTLNLPLIVRMDGDGLNSLEVTNLICYKNYLNIKVFVVKCHVEYHLKIAIKDSIMTFEELKALIVQNLKKLQKENSYENLMSPCILLIVLIAGKLTLDGVLNDVEN